MTAITMFQPEDQPRLTIRVMKVGHTSKVHAAFDLWGRTRGPGGDDVSVYINLSEDEAHQVADALLQVFPKKEQDAEPEPEDYVLPRNLQGPMLTDITLDDGTVLRLAIWFDTRGWEVRFDDLGRRGTTIGYVWESSESLWGVTMPGQHRSWQTRDMSLREALGRLIEKAPAA